MKLTCSRGCEWDIKPRQLYNYLRPGDRCPNVIGYNRMDGTTYCRRVLRLVATEEAEVEGAVLRADTNTPEFSR